METGLRAGTEPADVVGHGEERGGDGADLAVTLDQPVALGVGLEVIDGLDERNAGLLGKRSRRPAGRTADGY